jgi:hypothetical protein
MMTLMSRSTVLAGVFSIISIGAVSIATSPGHVAADGQGSVRQDSGETAIVQRFAGGGAWRGDTPGSRTRGTRDAQRPWFIHAVERDDGSVRAKLSVPGVPGFDDLTVEGQLIGEDAFGVLLHSSGAQVGTFNAKLSRDGNGGTFILGTGETGEWSYDAATRDEVRKAARTAVRP